jgi:WD40 repeat protein
VAAGSQQRILGEPNVEFNTAFSPDGSTLAAWSNDKTISVYDVASGALATTLEHPGLLWGADISPDGKTLASGGEDGTVAMWDLASGTALPALNGDLGKQYGSPLYVIDVAFSPDGKTLASADRDGVVRIWDLASASVSRKISVENVGPVVFSEDGSMLFVETIRTYNNANDHEYIVALYDPATGGLIRTFSGNPDKGAVMAVSPDGQLLAVGVGTYKAGVPSPDAAIVLYSVASGKELRRLTGPTDGVSALAFSPDGRLIASGAGDGDRIIRLWGVYP